MAEDRISVEQSLSLLDPEIREQSLQILLNIPNDLILILDPVGTLLLANQTFLRMSGYSLEEILHKNIQEILPPELGQARLKAVRQVAETGQAMRFEDRGVVAWFDNIIYPVFNAQQRVDKVVVQAREITARKQVEAELNQSLATIETLLNGPNDLSAVLDLDGRALMVNQTLANRLGATAEALIGKVIFDQLPEEIAARRLGYARQAIETGQMVRFQDEGISGIFDTVITPISDADGRIVRVAVVARDITELRQAEDELQKSRNQLEVILGAISDSVTVRDKDLRLIYANDAAARLKGFANGREYLARGRHGDDFVVIDPDGSRLSLDDYLRQHEASFQNGVPLELRYCRPGSTQDRWLQVKTAPIRDEDGTHRMTVFISRDITEQKRTLEELSRSRNELHQRVSERTSELAAANQGLRNEVELRREAEDELRIAVTRAETLARIATRLNAEHDLREIVQSVCEEALSIAPYQTASVCLYDENQDHLYVAAAQGAAALQLLQAGAMPRIRYEELMENSGDWMVIHDAQVYARQPNYAHWVRAGLRTTIVLTMQHAGEFIGALVLASHDAIHRPSEEDLILLRGVASLGATSVAKGLLFHQLDDARLRLQEMSKKMIEIQDGERRRLAMELHDQVGQMLTSLGLTLEQVERQVQARNSATVNGLAGEIATARQQVREVLEQVRAMSLRLRPAMLDDLGLVPALLAHFERFSASSGIRVDFRHSGLYDRFSSSIENAVFRMIQEGLTNVARYAGVDEVSVRLLAEEDLLIAQVRDLGAGFDADLRLAERTSSGLSGMSERVVLCGGQLIVESKPGHGTCLTAEFPLEPIRRAES